MEIHPNNYPFYKHEAAYTLAEGSGTYFWKNNFDRKQRTAGVSCIVRNTDKNFSIKTVILPETSTKTKREIKCSLII